jgi:hypothetical protein
VRIEPLIVKCRVRDRTIHLSPGFARQAAALEREAGQSWASLKKVKDRTRQTLERSAEQARFFEQGRNRWVKPGIAAERETPRDDAGGGHGAALAAVVHRPPDFDPIIQGLLSCLPKSGDVWPEMGGLEFRQGL